MREAIVFIDGNNWYHNSKKVVENPSRIDFVKLSNMVTNKFDLKLVGIRYYNSVPSVSDEVYEKHMSFIEKIRKSGVKVVVRELSGKGDHKREKGVDVLISVDMIRKSLMNKECDVCILLSGDADFIPVIELIKDESKEVIVSSVYVGFSRNLRHGNFRYWILNKKDLEDCFV